MKVRLKEDPREWRKNTLLTASALAVLSSLLRWRGHLGLHVWMALLLVLAGVALAACAQPRWFRGYYRLSTRVGFWLSQVLARILLGAIFLFLLTPLGLLLRLLGKDPLALKRSRSVATYWRQARESGPLDRLF